MNNLNDLHYVQHPTIPWQDLDGKKIAVPSGKGLHCGTFKLTVEKPIRDDGKYVLLLTNVAVIGSGSKREGSILPSRESLDQTTVSTITVAQPGTQIGDYVRTGGCDLMILPAA
jgi:hypothetical protein